MAAGPLLLIGPGLFRNGLKLEWNRFDWVIGLFAVGLLFGFAEWLTVLGSRVRRFAR